MSRSQQPGIERTSILKFGITINSFFQQQSSRKFRGLKLVLMSVIFAFGSVSMYAQPANDLCEDAIELAAGNLFLANINGATADDAPANCGPGVNNATGGGMWYTFTGSGNSLYEITTCFPATNFDTEMSVFKGTCGNLTCVDGNDDDDNCTSAPNSSTLLIFSPEVEPYYVYVKGNPAVGTFFRMSFIDESYLLPTNDICEDATVVTPGSTVSGNLTYASSDGAPANCGTGVNNADGVGIWYTFTGAPNTSYTITTCDNDTDFDTEMSLFAGTCGNLICLAGNDDDSFCSAGSTLSTLSVTPTTTSQYYIYVKGNNGAIGNFDLSIIELANDICANAIPIDLGEISEDITGATNTDAPVNCGTGVNNADGGGLWYTFTGSGNKLYELSTCIFTGTNFDTELSVFTGNCGNLICVDGNDDDADCPHSSNYSTIDFYSPIEEPYYVYLKGNNGAIGTAQLKFFNNSFLLPGNNLCENAEEIPTPSNGSQSMVSSSNENATTTGAPPNCGTNVVNDDSGGVWYKFTAEAFREYDVLTCSNETNFDTEISLFTGSCGNLTCYDGSDESFCSPDPVGFSSINSIYQTVQREFYIYVKGNQGATGNFELIIEDITPPPPANEVCSGARPIDVFWGGQESITGNTKYINNIAIAPDDCGSGVENDDIGGLWYSFTGTGNRYYEITTCAGITGFDTEISVYTGNCGSLACLDGNDDDVSCTPFSNRSTVNFQATSSPPGTPVTYYIYVNGNNEGYGAFTLAINDLSPSNDECGNPRPIYAPPGGTKTKSGTLDYATTNDAPVDCGSDIINSDSPGVWYLFKANPFTINEVTTCSPNTNFDTEFSIYQSCAAGSCITGNDDGSNCSWGSGSSSSTDTIYTNSFSYGFYYIYVKGNSGATGEFDITVNEIYPPNDNCDSPIHLVVPIGGSTSYIDSIYFSTYSPSYSASHCSGEGGEIYGAGLWYSFTAKAGRNYRVSNCNATTDFNSAILLYEEGDCNSLVCVAANDDDPDCTFSGGASTVEWTNNLGTDQDILVFVKNRFANNIGKFNLEISDISALPVELLSFTGRPEGRINQLEWTTASERNTAWHVIERAANGVEWEEIGEIAAAGESTNEIRYEFTDNSPLRKGYYRLKTIDFDGSISFSAIIVIERELDAGFAILDVFPVPTEDLLNVTYQTKSEERLTLMLFDIYGQLLKQEEINAAKGENQVQLNLNDIPAGTYLLSLTSREERISKRVLKVNR